MPLSQLPNFYTVMPAGGSGTRLWPLSRTNRPKFLLDLLGTGESLIQTTWHRLSELSEPDRMIVVTGDMHSKPVLEQLPDLSPDNLIREPSSLDTAPAIGLAAAIISQRDPHAVMGSFPADHIVKNTSEFVRAVTDAARSAERGYVTTIGIAPTHGSTAFGYIKTGAPIDPVGLPNVVEVRRFVEKPDARTAESYIAEGDWFWNAGMFVVRVDVILTELKRNRPELFAGILEIASAWYSDRQEQVLSDVWPTLERISLDHAVAEPAAPEGRVAVVPAALGWEDIGDWGALIDLLAPEGKVEPAVIGDLARVIASDSSGLIVANGQRCVQVHGLADVVIVDTPDVLLVTTKSRAQEVKRWVNELHQRGQIDLI